jgi:NAD(P)-dependent dehydrogenase (short-subunit alcohol dehydrogenase family)
MTTATMTHPMDLAGKVAIVTGGNRGLGLAMAKGLATAGCNVALWARDAERNRSAEAECAGLRGTVAAFAADVQDVTAIERALAATLARFGRVDGVFANAGIGGAGRTAFLEQTDAEWMHMLDVNVMGAKRVIAPVIAAMVAQVKSGTAKGGRVVLTSSVAALMGTAYNEAYAATKAALAAMARALAVEFGRHGITANALLPGYIETEMIDELLANEKFVQAMRPRLPLRRFALPEDYAGIAIYLMSDLSSYHTGSAIVIDGAFTVA